MTIKASATFKVSENIVFRKQKEDSYLLLEIEGDTVFEFDKVSAHIWDSITSGLTVEEIIKSIPENFEDLDKDYQSDVMEFIESLLSSKIILIN